VLHSSLMGTSGNGSAISVSVAEGEYGVASGAHRKPLLHLGRFQCTTPRLLRSLAALSSSAAFHLVVLSANGVAMFVLA